MHFNLLNKEADGESKDQELKPQVDMLLSEYSLTSTSKNMNEYLLLCAARL